MTDFKSYYSLKQRSVEAHLSRLFTDAPPHLAPFYRMMRYPIDAGGKRLRPVLVLMVNDTFGGADASVLDTACALELIHTYSLVHDDLPAMDDDELRRGKPTVHIRYGEGNAILVGDALLTYAFSLAARSPLSDSAVRAVTGELADAAGCSGMVGGQFLDLCNEGSAIAFELLTSIHALKTGALIRAAVRIGAVAGGADDDTLTALTRYGEAIGLAFQIQDDILDVTSDTASLGKPVGSDEKNDKSTYVKFFGLDGAQKKAAAAVDAALEAIASCKGAEQLTGLARYIIERRS
ncbi:MAG: polyprenyl synthetase family protein [Spirochaetota bacterium]